MNEMRFITTAALIAAFSCATAVSQLAQRTGAVPKSQSTEFLDKASKKEQKQNSKEEQ